MIMVTIARNVGVWHSSHASRGKLPLWQRRMDLWHRRRFLLRRSKAPQCLIERRKQSAILTSDSPQYSVCSIWAEVIAVTDAVMLEDIHKQSRDRSQRCRRNSGQEAFALPCKPSGRPLELSACLLHLAKPQNCLGLGCRKGSKEVDSCRFNAISLVPLARSLSGIEKADDERCRLFLHRLLRCVHG